MRRGYRKPVTATAIEYSLIGGFIAVAMLVAVTTVGTNLNGILGTAHGKVSFATPAP